MSFYFLIGLWFLSIKVGFEKLNGCYFVKLPLTEIILQVPNPLFDLAGIMCGQFRVPFWKFFLATLIGKALIKTHIQVCINSLVLVFQYYKV